MATLATVTRTRLRHRLPLQRLASGRLRILVVPALLWLAISALLLASHHGPPLAALRPFGLFNARPPRPAHRMPPLGPPLPPLPPPTPCYGPRGRLMPGNPDDDLQYAVLRDACTAPPCHVFLTDG